MAGETRIVFASEPVRWSKAGWVGIVRSLAINCAIDLNKCASRWVLTPPAKLCDVGEAAVLRQGALTCGAATALCWALPPSPSDGAGPRPPAKCASGLRACASAPEPAPPPWPKSSAAAFRALVGDRAAAEGPPCRA